MRPVRIDTMLLLGFSGKMGSGKNFVAEKLFLPLIAQKFGPVLPVAFADQIKINTAVKYGLTHEEVFVNKTAASRRLLQLEGTEEGRCKRGEDIWIRFLDSWLQVYKARGFRAAVVTDVRFKNEAEFIHSRGGKLVRIEAADRTAARMLAEGSNDAVARHSSETQLDAFDEFDLVVDNSMHVDVRKQLLAIHAFVEAL